MIFIYILCIVYVCLYLNILPFAYTNLYIYMILYVVYISIGIYLSYHSFNTKQEYKQLI